MPASLDYAFQYFVQLIILAVSTMKYESFTEASSPAIEVEHKHDVLCLESSLLYQGMLECEVLGMTVTFHNLS